MQIVVSGAGEGEDQMQAYEITGGQVRAVSEPLPLPGPVTALWPASVVLHNLRTGNYEASRLAMACAE